MGPAAKEYPKQYFLASALAASGCYPLWRSAAIGQSGFRMATMTVGGITVPQALAPYVYGFLPPYKGMFMTVFGMTYARAAIFYFSDYGHDVMLQKGYSEASATVAPPLVISTIVQVINQPIVRATVTLQDPSYNCNNVFQSIRHIYTNHGIAGLWHGTTAGVLKTVPKYCTAIAVKDAMERWLPQPDPASPTYESDRLQRSALKSATAGVAGAALTNPLDVIRNEQFKTHAGFRDTTRQLWNELGLGFLGRGLGKNMVAVALPVGCTIFFTEALIQWSQDHHFFGPSSATEKNNNSSNEETTASTTLKHK
mmetsp:Transcript_13785/g.22161  ORF Transcript_13785/g.22161 Transcript_13785/m.22161 type:complete len:311 (-) Transcript_13785:501-1433(-)